jgi:hypothetical protein
MFQGTCFFKSEKQITNIMTVHENINSTRRVDTLKRNRKGLNIITTVNHQTTILNKRERKQNVQSKWKKINKVTCISLHLSITFNVKRLNSLDTMENGLKNHRPSSMLPIRNSSQTGCHKTSYLGG